MNVDVCEESVFIRMDYWLLHYGNIGCGVLSLQKSQFVHYDEN